MKSFQLTSGVCLLTTLLAVIPSGVNLTAMNNLGSSSSAEEPIVWLCGAESSSRSYKARLNRAAASFALEIYSGSMFAPDHYLETVQIAIVSIGQRQLMGYGQTLTGTTIQVKAFGGSIEFHVEDSFWGIALGRCERIEDFN